MVDRMDDKTEGKRYGLWPEEIAELRRRGQEMANARPSAAEMLEKVGKCMQRRKQATARQISKSTHIRIADVRQSLARLINAGVVVREGEIWEDSVQQGQRFAAAYKWVGDDESTD
jgi:predicted HTH transcriptional regulator